MKVEFACFITALAAASPALAQQTVPSRTIEVVASGHASRPPDKASVGFMLRAEAPTADAALRQLRETRARFENELPIAASGRLEFVASDLGVHEVRPRGCGPSEMRTTVPPTSCRVTAYIASMDIIAWVRPPERAGQVLIRAAELGAVDPEFAGAAIDDSARLRDEAIAAAMADARAQAQQYARASGASLGPVLSVKAERTYEQASSMANMSLADPDDVSLRVGATGETVNVRVVFSMN